MMDVTAVGQAGGAAAPDPTQDVAPTDLQQAFAEGVVRFMAAELESSESDTISAINDTTSDPDAPS